MGSDAREQSGRITEAWQVLHPHLVGQTEKHIGSGLGTVLHETTRSQRASAVAGEKQRKVVVGVPVAVGIAAAMHVQFSCTQFNITNYEAPYV